MNLLAIDTSTERATVALAVDGEMFTQEQTNLREHAQFLLPMVERLLAAGQFSIKQLDGIIFGCGPGSFTGLRIACSIAKGLAYAHDRPVYPVSSLAAIAHEVYRTETDLNADIRVLAMIDARMHQVYWATFNAEIKSAQEQVTAVADISQAANLALIVAGVGFETYLPQLPVAIQAAIIKQRVVFPTAKAMIELVQTGHVQPISAAEALPVYVRNQVTHVVS